MENVNVNPVESLGTQKATAGMKQSLSRLINLLNCPLCGNLFDQPTTLSACAHSFCFKCIDKWCCDNVCCPVQGCRMPMSLVGGHGGKYHKMSPQLAQTVESVKLICQKLNKSPNDWWKTASNEYMIKPVSNQCMLVNDEDIDVDVSDDENMIDLQRGDDESQNLLQDSEEFNEQWLGMESQ